MPILFDLLPKELALLILPCNLAVVWVFLRLMLAALFLKKAPQKSAWTILRETGNTCAAKSGFTSATV